MGTQKPLHDWQSQDSNEAKLALMRQHGVVGASLLIPSTLWYVIDRCHPKLRTFDYASLEEREILNQLFYGEGWQSARNISFEKSARFARGTVLVCVHNPKYLHMAIGIRGFVHCLYQAGGLKELMGHAENNVAVNFRNYWGDGSLDIGGRGGGLQISAD